MKIIITEQQLNFLVETQSNKKSKFFELLIKYMYEPKSKFPFSLWTLHKYVKNWPEITYSERYDKDGNLEETTESLDLENHEIMSLTKDKLVFYANGDWQPEHVVTIKLVNGKLSVTDCRPYDRKKDKGKRPKKNELLKILGLEDDYKEKQKQYEEDSFNKLVDKYVEEYNKWNTEDGKTIGYKTPSESSVLEFIQNNHEQHNENKKLQKELLNKLQSVQLNETIEEKKTTIQNSIKYLHNLPTEYKEFALEHLKSYTKAKNGKITSLELPEDFKNRLKKENLPDGFDMGVDKNGYFIHTHRARNKSKENYMTISIKDIKFIDSTG